MFPPHVKKYFLLIFSGSCIFIHAAAQYCINGRFDTYLFDSTQTEILKDIPYGNALNYDGENQTLLLDIYRPKPALDTLEKKPLVVFVHGGGLSGGDKNTGGVVIVGKDLSERGFVYAGIEYRIGWHDLQNCEGDTTSLQFAFYRALQDTKASLRFLMENADVYGIDTNNIFIEGNSVGSTLAINAAYAQREDFASYLYDALGSIDSSGNTLYNHVPHIRGIITKAGGVERLSILNHDEVPLLMFHGTCDTIVPYETAPLFFCYSPVEYMIYHGSWSIARYLQEEDKTYWLYTKEGYGHSAVDDDTLLVYEGNFMKQILCGTFQTKEFYSFYKGGCIVNKNDDLSMDVYPNPFQNEIHLHVTGGFYGSVQFHVFDETGKEIFSGDQYFSAPLTDYTLDLTKYGLPHGAYFVRISGNEMENTVVLIH